jgi:plastocyanin
MRMIAGLTALCCAVLGGVLWRPAAVAAASSTQVSMANYAFAPASITVTAGDTVIWTNTDQAPHDVTTTSAPVAVHSSMLSKGQSWSYTFSTPGSYAYICSVHPDMKATVIVRPRPTAAVTTAAAAPRTQVRKLTPVARAITSRPSARKQRVPHTAAAPATATPASTTAAAPTTAPPVAASAPVAPSLRPLLLVTGLVAAVATLCLLLLGSRPERPDGAG